MTLFINTIELTNFRSYDSFTLKDISPLTIFIGPNAIGKTNLIEAIDLVTGISSFRNAKNPELVKDCNRPARVCAHISDEHRSLDLEMRIVEGKKKYFLNEKEKRAHTLKGMIPSVVFIPDDLALIKGSHSNRRRALDVLGQQLNVNYSVVKRDFDQVLSEKNNLLKNDSPAPLLDSFNEVLITCASQLFCYRVSLFNKLLPFIQTFYKDISHREEVVTAQYIPSWQRDGEADVVDPHDKEAVKEKLFQAIQTARAEEFARKHAIIGPHNDKVVFYIDGREAGVFGSQGQQRSLVLAWKLAEVSLIEEMMGVRPVLLLDDVMSELDELRRNELTKYVLKSAQTFITTTNRAYFSPEILQAAHIISLPYERED